MFPSLPAGGVRRRTAIKTKKYSVRYAGLARQVEEVARTLGPARRLVALKADNTLPSLVAYLTALSTGNPLLILSGAVLPPRQ